MSFNYQLAKEIYGMTPWFVDQNSFPALMTILNNSRNGITLDIPEQKYNSPSAYFYETKNEEVVTMSRFQWGGIPEDPNFKGIGLINIDGPITRSGGMSSYGMQEISSIMLKMNQDSRITGFLILADSGGGSSGAVGIMRDTISEIKKTKPVYGLISKGGMACSAMYGILAGCTKIYSEDKMNIVGSAGTMVNFDGKAANTESNGVKHIRVYASKSTMKNKAFEEALNNDNYELLINELLDPINEEFLANIESDRPQLKGTDFNNGNTKFSKDAVGTFIDGIKSFEDTFKELVSETKIYKKQSSNNNNLKSKSAMTIDELRQQFPDTYQSIFNAGVQAEKDRVGTWMAHFETDSQKVREGIKSGNPITATEREELLVKSTAKANMAKIEKDSPAKVVTNETVEKENPAKEEEDKEVVEFYKDLL